MSRTAIEIAEEIQESLRKNGKDVVTFSWKEFYEFVDRDRLKQAFYDELKEHLSALGLLVVYGQSVVLFGKDYRFAPFKAA
jgi:hypothetical protein